MLKHLHLFGAVLAFALLLVGCAHVHESLPGAAEAQASIALEAAAADSTAAGDVADRLKAIASFWGDAKAQLDPADGEPTVSIGMRSKAPLREQAETQGALLDEYVSRMEAGDTSAEEDLEVLKVQAEALEEFAKNLK